MRTPLHFGLYCVLVAAVPPPAAVSAPELFVGVATRDITPPRGFRMAGYYQERTNTGTKDPLQAKAIVLRQGERQAALVFCDLVGIPRMVSRKARERAQERTGIPAANIAVCATHSHTGPLYFGVLHRHFHEKAIAAQGSDSSERVDYAETLVEHVADVIAEAVRALAPARLAAGVGREEHLSFNRRFHMKDGSVVFNPGQGNPRIVRPAGPIDSDVGLLTVLGPRADAPRAVLTVFALHLDTVGGTEYSADYPHFLEVTLRKRLGADLVSLFAAGTCGDINHIDVNAQGRHSAGEIGEALARNVLADLPLQTPIASPSLEVARTVVEVPLQHSASEEIVEARVKLDRVGTPALPFLEAVEAVRRIDLAQNYPRGTLGLEVQAFRLGPDAAIVTLPGEVFVELGLAIKRASPFRTTLVVELANDVPAYIPTRRAFAEGSYEIVNSRVAPGGGEALGAAADRLLKSLAPTPSARNK